MPLTKPTLVAFANANFHKHRKAQPSGKHFLKRFTHGNVLARSFGYVDFAEMLAQDSIPITVSALNTYISDLQRRGFVCDMTAMQLTFASDTNFSGDEISELWIDSVRRKKSRVFFTDILSSQVPMLLPDGKGKWDVDPKSLIGTNWYKEILGDEFIADPRGRNEGALKLEQRFKNGDLTAAVPHALVLISDNRVNEAMTVLHTAADEGNADAHAELGRIYLLGNDVGASLSLAKHHLEIAAESEQMYALHVLGTLYGVKGALETNLTLSLAYHERAVAAGYYASIAWLGNAYYFGYGFEENIEAALSYYRRGVEVLDGCCLATYGSHLLRVESDAESAVLFFEASSISGDYEGQYYYGECLLYGWGCKMDYSQAVNQYRLSAASGYVPAMYKLGSCFLEGIGCEKSYDNALTWLLKASNKGHAEAMYKVGLCFANGHGVSVNYAAANNLFQDAGEQRAPYGYYLLAHAYRLGRGVEKDLNAYLKWLLESAKSGCHKAMLALAELYANSAFSEPDYDRSEYWMTMAEKTPKHCYYQYVDPEHLPYLPESYYTVQEGA